MLVGPYRDLGTVLEGKLIEDGVNLVVDGAFRLVQQRRDLAVLQTAPHHCGDFTFCRAEHPWRHHLVARRSSGTVIADRLRPEQAGGTLPGYTPAGPGAGL